MKARISVTDDDGRVFEGEVDLAPRGRGPGNPTTTRKLPKAKPADAKPTPPATLSYSMNPRAFMKKYAKDITGDRKFALLVSRLAKGSVSTEVPFKTVKGHWERMTGVIGKFNNAYSLRARENGWVDTKKAGIYVLTPEWKRALSG
jgi:hypothetical protein